MMLYACCERTSPCTRSFRPGCCSWCVHVDLLQADVTIKFGFAEQREYYGIMFYHKNRLIKPYVRVGIQLRTGPRGGGAGVVGYVRHLIG